VFHELGLANEERDQPHALLRQLVVYIAQPLQRMLGQALRLIAVRTSATPDRPTRCTEPTIATADNALQIQLVALPRLNLRTAR